MARRNPDTPWHLQETGAQKSAVSYIISLDWENKWFYYKMKCWGMKQCYLQLVGGNVFFFFILKSVTTAFITKQFQTFLLNVPVQTLSPNLLPPARAHEVIKSYKRGKRFSPCLCLFLFTEKQWGSKKKKKNKSRFSFLQTCVSQWSPFSQFMAPSPI